jgi:hypothetical protein
VAHSASLGQCRPLTHSDGTISSATVNCSPGRQACLVRSLRPWHLRNRPAGVSDAEQARARPADAVAATSAQGARVSGEVVVARTVLGCLHGTGAVPGRASCDGLPTLFCEEVKAVRDREARDVRSTHERAGDGDSAVRDHIRKGRDGSNGSLSRSLRSLTSMIWLYNQLLGYSTVSYCL